MVSSAHLTTSLHSHACSPFSISRHTSRRLAIEVAHPLDIRRRRFTRCPLLPLRPPLLSCLHMQSTTLWRACKMQMLPELKANAPLPRPAHCSAHIVSMITCRGCQFGPLALRAYRQVTRRAIPRSRVQLQRDISCNNVDHNDA